MATGELPEWYILLFGDEEDALRIWGRSYDLEEEAGD